MSAAVYWLYFFAAFALFSYCGRKLTGARWDRHRVPAAMLIVVCALAAAVLWPFTGVLAVIAWLVHLMFSLYTGRNPVKAEQRTATIRANPAGRITPRTVLPGLAASSAFLIGIVAFIGTLDATTTRSVSPDVSAQVANSTSPTLVPAPTVTPPVAVIPATTVAVAPPPAVVLAPTPTVTAAPAPIQKQTPRTVAPTTANPTHETASCGADYYLNSDGNCVHRPQHASAPPAGATAQCVDGTYSYSQHRQGTCSHHGGVAQWL